MMLFLAGSRAPACAEDAYAYDRRGKRDPFIPLVGVTSKISAGSIADILSIEDVDLQGIAGDSGGRMFAIINGDVITEGETIGRVTLKEISNYRITLIIDGSEYPVTIYEKEKE